MNRRRFLKLLGKAAVVTGVATTGVAAVGKILAPKEAEAWRGFASVTSEEKEQFRNIVEYLDSELQVAAGSDGFSYTGYWDRDKKGNPILTVETNIPVTHNHYGMDYLTIYVLQPYESGVVAVGDQNDTSGRGVQYAVAFTRKYANQEKRRRSDYGFKRAPDDYYYNDGDTRLQLKQGQQGDGQQWPGQQWPGQQKFQQSPNPDSGPQWQEPESPTGRGGNPWNNNQGKPSTRGQRPPAWSPK